MRAVYRKSFEVVGFTYWAAVYCLECGTGLPSVDPEGNERRAVFLDDVESLEGSSCDWCGSSVLDW
jgi:hypothetical protein